ncbi:hypothetical protein ABZZ20_25550 [Streptomyces sp. NPDC006430]|uniref:hypothetical protein n=1 Tax=Streptomyces sp. NPDC006430 TaxID=3154299 RepID=UPI0033AC2D06
MDASRGGGAGRARSAVRNAALLCAAAGLAAGAAPASARAPAAPDPVVVVDCSSQAQVRPEEYVLACGDGNNQLIRLRWDTWGPQTATATGTDMVNDCRPYCAAGRFHPYPVRVTLGNPQRWPDHPDLRRFTTIRLLYPEAAPAPVAKDVTYKLVY